MEAKALTVKEAADFTGHTEKALRRRIERGQLRTTRKDGKVAILKADLVGLPKGGESIGAGLGNAGNGEALGQVPGITETLTELVARLEAQAEELGRFKALTEQAQSREEALETELQRVQSLVVQREAEATALKAQLEANVAKKGRWLRRRKDAPSTLPTGQETAL